MGYHSTKSEAVCLQRVLGLQDTVTCSSFFTGIEVGNGDWDISEGRG